MSSSVSLSINGVPRRFTGDLDMPLLWYVREDLELVGTKFGCGVGACGACTVHVNGAATRSCVLPMSAMDGRRVTTIEGLGRGDALHAVQQAWIDEDVAQCGYCQAGQVMTAAALLATNPRPDDAAIDAAIDAAMQGICRCGTYVRIRRAVHRAADLLAAAR